MERSFMTRNYYNILYIMKKINSETDLTNREKCVLNYVCKGLSNKDIANELKSNGLYYKKACKQYT